MRQSVIAVALGSVLGLVSTPVLAADALPIGEAALIHDLTQAVGSTHMESAKVAVNVVDVETGKEIYGKNTDAQMNPASCMKLLTSLAALRELGPSYSYKTRIMATKAPAKGVIKGDLYIIGSGDPVLNLQNVWRVADLVRRAGVEKVEGRVMIDATAFDDQESNPGSENFSENRAYNAPNGALSINWNTVAFVVRPGAGVGEKPHVVIDPPTTFVTFTNKATTVGAGKKKTVSVNQVKPDTFVIEGNLPINRREKAYYRAISNPEKYAGHIFKEYLAQVGVTVSGTTGVGKVPAGAKELAAWDSPPMSELVRLLNKHSSNFIAEQLTKTLGNKATGRPGTTEAGLEVIRKHVQDVGIKPDTYTITNGSGLNRSTRVSVRQLTTVLSAAYQDFSMRPEYVGSLPIAASDGTIQWRMGGTAAAQSVRAKTGTLRGVSCLAGFASARNGRVLSFAVLVNNVDGSLARAQALQDRIGAILASWSDSKRAQAPLEKK